MLRRLMLAVLALCAFLALEGCGANRLTAPQAANGANPPVVGNNDPVTQPAGGGGEVPPTEDPILPGGGHASRVPSTDDGGAGSSSGGANTSGTAIEADSLTVSLDHAK